MFGRFSTSWAAAGRASPASMVAESSAVAIRFFILSSIQPGFRASSIASRSVREWPYDQLLPRHRPETGQAVRLEDQKQDDERPDDHDVEVIDGGGRKRDAERRRHRADDDGKRHDQDRAEIVAEDRAQPAD